MSPLLAALGPLFTPDRCAGARSGGLRIANASRRPGPWGHFAGESPRAMAKATGGTWRARAWRMHPPKAAGRAEAQTGSHAHADSSSSPCRPRPPLLPLKSRLPPRDLSGPLLADWQGSTRAFRPDCAVLK